MENITQIVRELVNKVDRYSNFTVLNKPVPFNKAFSGMDIPIVQVHMVDSENISEICGFCGGFEWVGDRLRPLDGDSYDPEMLVYGYNWFMCECGNGLDILVSDW